MNIITNESTFRSSHFAVDVDKLIRRIGGEAEFKFVQYCEGKTPTTEEVQFRRKVDGRLLVITIAHDLPAGANLRYKWPEPKDECTSSAHHDA